MEKRYFTLEEANGELPKLQEAFERIFEVKKNIEEYIQSLEETGVDTQSLFSETQLPQDWERHRNHIEQMADEIDDHLHSILERGILVKDIETGLVDFYAQVDGQDVFLCWRMGEPEVQFWHGIQEGFPGRKTLFDREVLSSISKVH